MDEGMPANLTPQYKAAEAAFRRARDPEERLDCLREMLRTIPKHKGTEHLRAEIKSRISEMTEELSGPRKGAARGGPVTVFRPEGAAQVALVGPPNSGKSALHAVLTGSHADAEPYPFATQYPQPGMLPHQDVAFQLIDLPSVSPQHPVPWIGNALQPADACMLVIDIGDPDCVDQVHQVHEMLLEKGVALTTVWPADRRGPGTGVADGDPFTIHLPTVMIATKADLFEDMKGELQVFRELADLPYAVLAVSTVTGEGLDAVGPWLFRELEIVRVYTKAPGRPPDDGRPFTVRRGQTVHDVALLVHKDIAEGLRYARLWGGGHDGQQVGREHMVEDGDVLEMHI